MTQVYVLCWENDTTWKWYVWGVYSDLDVAFLARDTLAAKFPEKKFKIVLEHWMKRTGMGWQPIETAPKDGTWLLMADEATIFLGCYRYNLKQWVMNGWCVAPTHWMPLPKPPY
jgi:hypothetical protein